MSIDEKSRPKPFYLWRKKENKHLNTRNISFLCEIIEKKFYMFTKKKVQARFDWDFNIIWFYYFNEHFEKRIIAS